MIDERVPAPFLKWAGGKRQLVERILAIIPPAVDTYYEPFVGGGAVFFALAAEAPRRFRRAVLADANRELVDCYAAVRDDVDGVIAALSSHRYDRDYYYRLRDHPGARMTRAARAARLIYLNRCGFNGLYRVNSRGEFNVPFGRHGGSLVICDPPKLQAASAALRGVTIEEGDFEETVKDARPGDFIYLDPPYVPVSSTSYFTAYARGKFGPAEQARLADLLRALGARGVHALLSNSDCGTTRTLYDGLKCARVPVRRNINSVASRRGAVGELLVTSFAFAPARKAKGRERRALSASAAGLPRLTLTRSRSTPSPSLSPREKGKHASSAHKQNRRARVLHTRDVQPDES